MNELVKRIVTGVLFIAVLTGGILWSPFSLAILFLFCALVGVNEFHGLLKKGGFGYAGWRTEQVATLVLHVITFAVFVREEPTEWLWLMPVLLVLLTFQQLFQNDVRSVQSVGWALLGQIWIALPFALLTALAHLHGDFDGTTVLGFFILLWINDTGAYVAGRLLGRHKLAPSISPGKTIEGFIGGVALALTVAWFMGDWFTIIERRDWLVIGAIIAVFSNAGDLFESVVKRSCDAKDSGTLLPGHGGILDRFDGILLSVPIVVAYLHIVNA
jgi:phosphatidate cytidylyltransferase